MRNTMRDLIVAQGQALELEGQVARQRAIVEDLESRGLEMEVAREVLESFQAILQEKRARVEEIYTALSRVGNSSPGA